MYQFAPAKTLADVPPVRVSPVSRLTAVRATCGVICCEQGVRLTAIALPFWSVIEMTGAGAQ